MKNIDVFFSSDDNYAQHMGVAICSMFENKNSGYLINIYILDGGISEINKSKLFQISKKYTFNIKYIQIDIKKYKKLFIDKHITHAAYYRISIPDLIDKEIKKVLYLDCDIIIQKDILELFNINIDKYFLGAIEEKVLNIKQNLNMDNHPYFNSGVMLINCNIWKKYNITEKTLEFVSKNPEKIKLWDQDALNYVLKNKWLSLDKKYNFLSSEIERIKKNNENINIEPIIIHYSSSIKPWRLNGHHPFNELYFYYLKKTPWNKKIYANNLLRNLLIEFNIMKNNFIQILIKLKKK